MSWFGPALVDAMTKDDGDIVFTPHTTGACVLILDEAEATAMRDTLSEWLG